MMLTLQNDNNHSNLINKHFQCALSSDDAANACSQQFLVGTSVVQAVVLVQVLVLYKENTHSFLLSGYSFTQMEWAMTIFLR